MYLRNPFAQFISSIAALVVASATVLIAPESPEPPAPQQPAQPPSDPGAPQGPGAPQVEPPLPPPRAAIDPEALRLVKGVGEHIERSNAFSSRITYSFEIRGPGPRAPEAEMTQRMTHELAFQQPNLMRLELVDGPTGETIISDGESMFIHLPQKNRYLQQDAPSDLRGLMEHPGAVMGAPGGLGGPLSFLGMMLVPEMFDGLAPLLQSAAYLGTEEIDGEETHRVTLAIALPSPPERPAPPADGLNVPHEPEAPGAPAPGFSPGRPPLTPPASNSDMRIRASHDDENLQVPPEEHSLPPLREDARPVPTVAPQLNLDLWIQERGDNAVLRRMRIDLAHLLRGHDAVPQELEDFSIDVWIHLNDWTFNVELPEETFTFDPPDGAERVESLRDMIVMDGSDADRHPLIGRPAPNFQLQRLVGTALELDEHLGEDVIVLDFWSTWCTPCVRAIPHLMSVADDFRGQNVAFYFVNLREDFDRVQRFVEERGWEGRIKVPMDIDGRVAQEYKVSGIPQTVIIGKDGIVQAVHVGFAPGMEDRLRKEIQTLLDGGTLIEEKQEENNEDDDDEDE